MRLDPLAVGVIIVGMGIVTYAIRLALIVLLGHAEVPPLLRRALRFVPPAVLSALIFPEVFQPAGTLAASLASPRLLAGLVAALVAWRSRNALLAISLGMAALWALQLLLP
jgi:branched-subunit amino acid transport protein